MTQMDNPLQLPSVASTLERSIYICFIQSIFVTKSYGMRNA